MRIARISEEHIIVLKASSYKGVIREDMGNMGVFCRTILKMLL